MAEDGLQRLELNLHPNEASGLLTVEDESLLEAHGWELAFWAVLDEGDRRGRGRPSPSHPSPDGLVWQGPRQIGEIWPPGRCTGSCRPL